MIEPGIDRPSAGEFRTVARLHAESITEGFLSTLGLPFLSALYRGINAAPNSGVLVARCAGQVLGFADLGACYRWVLTRRFLPLACSLLPRLLCLSVHRKIIETLLYPARSEREALNAACHRPPAELLAISVSDQARGRGIGRKLLAEVDRCFKTLRVSNYCVVTHATDQRSNGFYEGCGFRQVRSFTNHGKPMHEYIRVLARPDRV
jgi:ribosomal protein S18 acetylase RimI-like enzyme